MQTITLLRKIIEEIELCITFEVNRADDSTVIYFSYADPVDLVVWIIKTEYFDKNLTTFFKVARKKDKSQHDWTKSIN